MQKQRIILIIGVALALISVFMVKMYLDQQRQVIMQQEKQRLAKIQASQVTVLVAQKAIAAGTAITADMIDAVIMLNRDKDPRAVSSLERVEGMITSAPIAKGEQITLDKVTRVKQAGGLAEVTPVGKRAITILVDNLSSLAGMIKPGDYTDVIGMIPIPVQTPDGKQTTQTAVLPLFQNVLVLAVGQDTSAQAMAVSRYQKEGKTATISPFITLALSPQEANFIAFVQEQGKIRLVLRSPVDAQVQQIQPANWETLFQYILPKKAEAPKVEPKKEEQEYIDIYRGLSKERIPISK